MKYIVEISYVSNPNFNGWQVQKNKPSYQGTLEDVFSEVLGKNVAIVGSGRTDSGVSAIKQVAHFEYDKTLPKNFVGHVNSLLPEEVRVLNINECDESFHARFDAKQKTYKYFFYNSNVPIPFYDKFALQVKGNFNFDKMQKELNSLIGKHDFSSFCASGSSVKDFVRNIYDVKLEKFDDLYVLSITGSGFLYNMVRIIVGTIIDIGQGKQKLTLKQIIDKKDRIYAGKTAPATGLVLSEVKYDLL